MKFYSEFEQNDVGVYIVKFYNDENHYYGYNLFTNRDLVDSVRVMWAVNPNLCLAFVNIRK